MRETRKKRRSNLEQLNETKIKVDFGRLDMSVLLDLKKFYDPENIFKYKDKAELAEIIFNFFDDMKITDEIQIMKDFIKKVEDEESVLMEKKSDYFFRKSENKNK